MRDREGIRVVLSNYGCELRECLIYTFHLYNDFPHKVIPRVSSVVPVEAMKTRCW